MNEVTQILHAIEQGDPTASEQLLPLVYDVLGATRIGLIVLVQFGIPQNNNEWTNFSRNRGYSTCVGVHEVASTAVPDF